MKTFVMGDIHGCYDEFEKLLERLKIDFKNDRLILLGDYIDRGDKSYEVVRRILELQREYGVDRVILLRGNHEQMAIEYFEEDRTSYLYNGGRSTIESFKRNNDDLEHYLEFFKMLPSYYQDDNFIYVHGGVRPGIKLEEQRDNDLLWIREEFYLNSKVDDKAVIFGHTPTCYINGEYYPANIQNNIAVDTACVYGGYLSALELEAGRVVEIHQIKNERMGRRGICA